jgi:4-amino-4-deoxy-L-arabinose transferase-like glycosyltransferase
MRRALLVAFVAALALWDLGGRSLHVHDTARWGLLAREMVQGGEWLVPHRYGELYVNKPPLYLWAVAAPSALRGEVTPFLVRLPSALGLIALVLATAAWGRLRLGSVRRGQVAALLTLATPAVFWLGREGRLDMMGSALAVLAAWQLDLAASGQGRRRTPWVAGLLLGLALLTKGPPLLLVPLLAWLLPPPGGRLVPRMRAARPWIVFPVMLGVALAWFVPAVLSAGWAAYGYPLLVGQAADRLAGESTHTHGALYYLGDVAGEMGPFGVAYLLLGLAALLPRLRARQGAAGPLALGFALGLLLFSLVPTKQMRYLIPLVPLGAMALTDLLERVVLVEGRATARRLAWTGAAGLGLAAVTALVLAFRAPYGAPWAVVVPALLLLAVAVLSVLALGRRWCAPHDVALAGLTVGLALLLSAGLALRSRWFTTDKETFVRAVAAALKPGDRLVTVQGTTPELVFHAAGHADHIPDPRQVPWTSHPGGWVVIGRQGHEAEIEAASGRPATRVAARGEAGEVALRLAGLGGDDAAPPGG